MIVVEGPKGFEVLADGKEPPRLLVDKKGEYFVLAGQYCSPGNRYQYFNVKPVSF